MNNSQIKYGYNNMINYDNDYNMVNTTYGNNNFEKPNN